MNEPIHLAIIPDGNRRWAKKRGLLPWQGHEAAIKVLQSMVDFCLQHEQIGVLTLWLFSTENWKRDPLEIKKLMQLLERYLRSKKNDWVNKQIRFVHSGRKDRIPNSLREIITELEAETNTFINFTVHLALDYGGKDEVTRAVRMLAQAKPEVEITAEAIASKLDHPELPDLDIIIRTSGEMRTSNFFLWQSTYAEWFFVEKYLPDITIKDVEEVLGEFSKRTRRFGGS